MARSPAAASGMLALLLLAGCTEPAAPTPVRSGIELPPPEPGLGAIAGLLVDDRYRPVPDARILLFPLGLETPTDAVGQFVFYDLEPGAYELRALADGHEAAPMAVDVEEGYYAEAEVEARRIASDTAHVVTEQHTVFVACAVSAVLTTLSWGCLLDGSDSYTWSYRTDYREHNATYVVSEFLASEPDGYRIVWWGCDYTSQEFEGTYTRLVLKAGEPQNGTVPWHKRCPVDAYLYYTGSATEVTKQLGWGYGLGARLGIKGQFLNTVFIGPPEVDPLTYGVLGPAGQA